MDKTQKQNQLRFIEYEKPTRDGHFITVSDSYHNVIARIHKSFNQEIKKYEYAAFDHAGNLMGKSDRLWQLKNEFINNREQLLEQAHQRRIESKLKAKEAADEKRQSMQPSKESGRNSEIQKMREGKLSPDKQIQKESLETKNAGMSSERDTSSNNSGNYQDDENSRQDEREQELDDLRNADENNRGDCSYNMEKASCPVGNLKMNDLISQFEKMRIIP